MKHLFIILSTIMVFPALANIDAENESPTCDESVLNASNGTANLEINWEPNVIPLRWYSGNTLLEPENNDDTCTYDGVLNRPTNPTREGYNFAGWRIRPTMDFSDIPINKNGIERWAKGSLGCWYDKHLSMISGETCYRDNTFSKLQKYEWKVHFEHGDVYGMSGCSGLVGTYAEPGNPVISNGTSNHCWCRATGYKLINQNVINASLITPFWIYYNNAGSPAFCAQVCATYCARETMRSSDFRAGLFTPTNNQ